MHSWKECFANPNGPNYKPNYTPKPKTGNGQGKGKQSDVHLNDDTSEQSKKVDLNEDNHWLDELSVDEAIIDERLRKANHHQVSHDYRVGKCAYLKNDKAKDGFTRFKRKLLFRPNHFIQKGNSGVCRVKQNNATVQFFFHIPHRR